MKELSEPEQASIIVDSILNEFLKKKVPARVGVTACISAAVLGMTLLDVKPDEFSRFIKDIDEEFKKVYELKKKLGL